MTKQQQTQALAICDRILAGHDRAYRNLSEGIKGLIETFDELARKCQQEHK